MEHMKAVRDSLYTKIGRNMILFQKLEGLLKMLLARSEFSGTSGDLKSCFQKQEAIQHRKTLGMLVNDYVNDVIGPEPDEPLQAPESPTEVGFAMRFRWEHPPELLAEREKQLRELVDRRNELVHHLLPGLDLDSEESCNATAEQLDEQAAVIRAEMQSMGALVKSICSGYRQAVEAVFDQ